MAFELPSLGYEYGALEPYIDSKTMEVHYTKHHKTYVDKLNSALEAYPELTNKPITELISGLDKVPEQVRSAVRNNGGGHLNHSFFWSILSSEKTEPSEEFLGKLKEYFGDFEGFKSEFRNSAMSRFGSGWAWLVLNKEGGLDIISTPNQDSPVSQGLIPLVGLDVWEHAYYLKYQNKRAEYIDAFFEIINWSAVEEIYFGEVQNIKQE